MPFISTIGFTILYYIADLDDTPQPRFYYPGITSIIKSISIHLEKMLKYEEFNKNEQVQQAKCIGQKKCWTWQLHKDTRRHQPIEFGDGVTSKMSSTEIPCRNP